MWILIGSVVLAAASTLLFVLMSMAQTEESLAREAERELESTVSGAAYEMLSPVRATAARDQSADGKFSSGNDGRNHEPVNEEALA